MAHDHHHQDAPPAPAPREWLQYNKGVFGRMITMFTWIIVVGFLVLVGLWALTA